LHELSAHIQTLLMRYFYLVISMDAYGPELVKEHEAIVGAIRARDSEAARQHAADHVRHTVDRSVRLMVTSSNVPLGGLTLDRVLTPLRPDNHKSAPRARRPLARAATNASG
jgi:hypothetical protein